MDLSNKSKVVIFYARPYSMVLEDSGDTLEGVSVEYYFFGENGEMMKPTFDADAEVLGIRRSKATLPLSAKDKLQYVPGVYDGDFMLNVDKDGKAGLRLTDINYAGKFLAALEPVAEQPAAPDQKQDVPSAGKGVNK